VRKAVVIFLFFAPVAYFLSYVARSTDQPMWIQSLYLLVGISIFGAIYLAITRIGPRLTGWESAQADDMPRIRVDLAGAFIGMAALNATFLSVMIRDPGLFLLAMIGNILVFVVICWLARDKGERGGDRAEPSGG